MSSDEEPYDDDFEEDDCLQSKQLRKEIEELKEQLNKCDPVQKNIHDVLQTLKNNKNSR